MRHSIFAILLLAGGLAGCVAEGPGGGDPHARCGAGELQSLVGEPQSVLEGMRFSQPLRVIGYDTAVTMDFNPDRLNIDLGPDGRITRVWCG